MADSSGSGVVILVHSGDNIFIDAGTTTYEMVPFLAEIPDVKIITNGVETKIIQINSIFSKIKQLNAKKEAII